MFPCMKISCTFCQHLGPQIISLVNRKNQPNGKKKESFCLQPFHNGFCSLQNSYIYPTLFKQVNYMNIAKHRRMHTYP